MKQQDSETQAVNVALNELDITAAAEGEAIIKLASLRPSRRPLCFDAILIPLPIRPVVSIASKKRSVALGVRA